MFSVEKRVLLQGWKREKYLFIIQFLRKGTHLRDVKPYGTQMIIDKGVPLGSI